jgi:hypothetical protein
MKEEAGRRGSKLEREIDGERKSKRTRLKVA